MWSRKFLACAVVKKYREILLGEVVVPFDINGDEDEEAQLEAQRYAQELNDLAYSELILCCEESVSFGAVDEARTDDLPHGSAHLAWSNLIAKFEPRTSASKVNLRQQFAASKLEDPMKNPDEWLADLERIRQQLSSLGSPMSDEDMIIHILNNMPPEYETLAERMEDQLEVLLLSELREQLRNKYQRIIKLKNITKK
jgi:hypothetical protein